MCVGKASRARRPVDALRLLKGGSASTASISGAPLRADHRRRIFYAMSLGATRPWARASSFAVTLVRCSAYPSTLLSQRTTRLQSSAASRFFSSVSLPQSLSMLGNCARRGFERTQPKGGTIGAPPFSDASHMAKWAKYGSAFGRAGDDWMFGVGSSVFVVRKSRFKPTGGDLASRRRASRSAHTESANSAAARVP